jgi:single-strand DNA-binding protein
MNSVNLIGNLATEIDVRVLDGERKVASFVLAVDRIAADGGADFIRVSTWNRQAELCETYIRRGSLVGVEGRLRSRSWDDPDGKRRSALEVVAARVEFLSRRDGEGAGPRNGVPFEAVGAA